MFSMKFAIQLAFNSLKPASERRNELKSIGHEYALTVAKLHRSCLNHVIYHVVDAVCQTGLEACRAAVTSWSERTWRMNECEKERERA